MSTNGALTTLLNAPGAAGTTFEVAANTGAWFVAGPAIVYRAGTTVFSKTNLEAVTLSAPVGDAITVTRAQQGHAALTLAAGDFLVQGITALDWDTLKALVESQGSTLAGVTVTGTPAAGKAVVAVSASAAQWTDVATQAELDAFTVSGSGTYAPISRVGYEASQMYVYGHSYTREPGLQCTSGAEFHKRVKARLGFAGVTSYGVGSARMVEAFSDALALSWKTPVTGCTWDGTRRGAVILDCQFNDCVNPVSGGAASALSAGQITNYADALRAFLHVVGSSGRVEFESGTLSNATSNAGTQYGGGNVVQLNAVNGYAEVTATVPLSGEVVVILWTLATQVLSGKTGAYTVSVDGTTVATGGPDVGAWTQIISNRGGGTTINLGPRSVRLTGLTPGSRTIRVTRTDSPNGIVYPDTLLLKSATPVPVAVLLDPPPNTTGSNGNTSDPNRATYVANKALLDPVIRSVCAEFSNVTVIDTGTPLVSGSGLAIAEGAHPSDRGMQIMADTVLTGWPPAALGISGVFPLI